jgi:hypothetical protein
MSVIVVNRASSPANVNVVSTTSALPVTFSGNKQNDKTYTVIAQLFETATSATVYTFHATFCSLYTISGNTTGSQRVRVTLTYAPTFNSTTAGSPASQYRGRCCIAFVHNLDPAPTSFGSIGISIDNASATANTFSRASTAKTTLPILMYCRPYYASIGVGLGSTYCAPFVFDLSLPTDEPDVDTLYSVYFVHDEMGTADVSNLSIVQAFIECV